jgi:hypothetical protein
MLVSVRLARDTCELRIYKDRKRQDKRASVPTSSDKCGRSRVGYVDIFKENKRSA